MAAQKENELKKKIIAEMTVDHSDILEKNFDRAKKLIGLTKDGKVDVLVKDKLSAREQILLYLVRKQYAKRAGIAQSEDVGNKELMDQLGMPGGTVRGKLTELKDEKMVGQRKQGYHSIPAHLVERTLKSVEEKLKQGGEK